MPGWNDLSAVRAILVWIGAVAWLFLAALAFFELLAHRKTKNEYAFEAAGIACFVLFVLLDLGTYLYGIRHDELAVQEIAQLNLQLSDNEKEAARFNKEAADAYERAAKAEGELASAKRDAAVARKEAEGFQVQIAKSDERAAEAEVKASQADSKYESERAARIKIEQRMADREILPQQRGKMLQILKTRSGEHIEVDSLLVAGAEGQKYASQIAEIFRESGWTVGGLTGMRAFQSTPPVTGLIVCVAAGDPGSMSMGEFIASVFSHSGISTSLANDTSLSGGKVLVLIAGK